MKQLKNMKTSPGNGFHFFSFMSFLIFMVKFPLFRELAVQFSGGSRFWFKDLRWLCYALSHEHTKPGR